MHPFPRQASSGGAVSSSDTTPTTSTVATSSQTTTSTDATSDPLSSSSTTSTASPSTSAALTTSSVSTDTTSSHSSTSSTSSSSTGTTSNAATSSSSTSGTTSSASSYVPSSSTTQFTTSSSSQQQTTTTITSAYTTYINGSQILTSTSYPSTIPNSSLSSASSSSDRTAIIAGSAAGGTAFIILILTFAFYVRRKRFKRVHFLDAITLKRKQARSRATLFDGEDLDVAQPPHSFPDHEAPWDGNDRALMAGRMLNTPAPARWADTGSAFREEVWPPPNEATRLMDPFANRHDLSLDLSRIVEDVMGPSHAHTHFSERSISSIHRGSVADSQGTHSRSASNTSHAALLEAAGLSGSAPTAPVRPSPLAQQGTTSNSVEGQGGDT